MRRICYLTILVILLLPAYAYGQYDQFPMGHFTTDDGLPSNTVYDICRDNDGFLWFCTDKGVARYNGIKFETFTTYNGLTDNEVFFAKQDLYGRIWFATFNGTLCYYHNNSFHSAKNTPFLKIPHKTSFVKSISIEKDSSVTISFYDHRIFINVIHDHCDIINIEQFKPMPGSGEASVSGSINIHTIAKEGKRKYAVFTEGRRTIYIDDSARILYSTPNPDSIGHTSFSGNTNYFMSTTAIYATNQMKPFKTFNPARLLSHHIYHLFSHGGYLFCATSTGLLVTRTDMVDITKGYTLLPGDKVSTVLSDGIKNIWIGTLNDGVYIAPLDFEAYKLLPTTYQGKVLYADCVKGNCFFGTTTNQLYHIKKDSSYCLFDYDKWQGKKAPTVDLPSFLVDENFKFYFFNIQNVVVDNIWNKRSEFHTYKNPLYGGIKYLYEEGSQLYVQARRSLLLIDYPSLNEGDHLDNGRSRHITSDAMNSDRIFCMAQNADGSIWYSTINGIYRVVGDQTSLQKQFGNFQLKNFVFFKDKLVGYTHENELVICSNYMSAIHMDKLDLGNFIWDKFYVLDSAHLMISTNSQYQLLTVGHGSDKNTVIVNPIEDEYIPTKTEAICIDSQYCHFFKDGTITSVRKDKFLFVSPPPKLIFTTARTSEHVFSIKDGTNLIFTYVEARDVSIGFASISYISKSLSYQYAIDKDGTTTWNPIQGDQINLANPRYGTYTIRMRARSLSGEWSSPISCTITIRRPYWATWWFVGCVLLLAGTIMVWFVKRRINAVIRTKARENENKVRYLKSEYKALNALMNPHFIFNTLNNVQGLFNRDDKRAANEYLRIFADLIRQNMHNVSMEMISLEKEMELVKNYLLLEKLRFKENLHYQVTIGENVDTSEIMVPPLLIQPLVENSIKHGILPLESSSGIVKVDLNEKDFVLYIRVADNGVGLNSKDHKKDSAHISFGLDNIKRRIEQLSAILQKDLNFEMKEEVIDGQRWTVSLITIPV